MEYKQVQCREHGGMFSVPVKRGRPPVRCTPDNVCDMTAKKRQRQAAGAAKAVSRTLKGAVPKPSASGGRRSAKVAEIEHKVSQTHTRRPRKASEVSSVVVRHNPSIVLAKGARDQLEPLGWTCKGRAWFDSFDVGNGQEQIGMSELIARRGEELLIIRWRDGKPETQDYQLWNADKGPQANGKPKSRLPFNPYELTDHELALELMGREVTWWNRIKQGSEKDVVSKEKIKIEHTFSGNGSEPLRIVTFNGRHGFRAFHVDALMRVSR